MAALVNPSHTCSAPDAETHALVEGALRAPVPPDRADHWLIAAWGLSIAVHVLLLGVMFVLPWLARQVTPEDDLAVAQTELVEMRDAPKTSLVDQPLQFGRVRKPEISAIKFEPKRTEPAALLGRPNHSSLPVIGLGAGGGNLGKYGLGMGEGDAGPQFFGLGSEARDAKRIVYVVDHSGSMTGTFGAVQRELLRSVERLRRSKRFHVIFFNSGAPLENPPKQLVHASRKEKAALSRFVETVQPGGGTDPIPAMRRAFAVKPDLIYFLTDGEFSPQLLTELRKWNRNERVRIFTIAYVSPTGAALLEQIAREHHGRFRFVSEYDL